MWLAHYIFAQKETTLHYPPRHKQRQCVGMTTGCPMGGKVSDYGAADFIQHVLYVCRDAEYTMLLKHLLKLKLSGYDVCYL